MVDARLIWIALIFQKLLDNAHREETCTNGRVVPSTDDFRCLHEWTQNELDGLENIPFVSIYLEAAQPIETMIRKETSLRELY
jgi:hypothetical protein